MSSGSMGYLRISGKAGFLEIGEVNCGSAVRAGKAKLLMLAEDSSDNAAARASGFVEGRRTQLIRLPYTKGELSETMGKRGCSMAVITDTGLALSFVEALREEYGERYEEVCRHLREKLERERRRKAEMRARERNRRQGKRRTKHE